MFPVKKIDEELSVINKQTKALDLCIGYLSSISDGRAYPSGISDHNRNTVHWMCKDYLDLYIPIEWKEDFYLSKDGSFFARISPPTMDEMPPLSSIQKGIETLKEHRIFLYSIKENIIKTIPHRILGYQYINGSPMLLVETDFSHQYHIDNYLSIPLSDMELIEYTPPRRNRLHAKKKSRINASVKILQDYLKEGEYIEET